MATTDDLRTPKDIASRDEADDARPGVVTAARRRPGAKPVRAPPGAEPVGAAFHGILFPYPERDIPPEPGETPELFRDLNLDQAVESLVAGRDEYNLRAFFLHALHDVEVIRYRQEVMRDLEDPARLEQLRGFAAAMRDMRGHLATAGKLYYKEQKEAWLLEAVGIYCEAVERLAAGLESRRPASRGLSLFSDHLGLYVRSAEFAALRTETASLKAALAETRYSVLIDGDWVRVRRYQGERDYAADVAATFAKFAQRGVKSYLVKFADLDEMNHIEAAILARVARLHPALFAELASYGERRQTFCDATIAAFDREIQFYLAYQEYTAPLRRAGLRFCYPRLSTSKAVIARETFDLILARQLLKDDRAPVPNNLHLAGRERIFVVSGPNQGGKTTFARIFGQLHYLASLGPPVPGSEAHLFLFDRLYTHFEKEEQVGALRGKLEDDLLRIRDILTRATPDSIIILNEIFTSTTLSDAVLLSREILRRIIRLDALCVCVTFIDELATLGEQTVSMVSTVVPDDPAKRTYKIVRRPGGALAYAMTIAEKYRLTYDRLKERMPS
jgi:hypothetical protein